MNYFAVVSGVHVLIIMGALKHSKQAWCREAAFFAN